MQIVCRLVNDSIVFLFLEVESDVVLFLNVVYSRQGLTFCVFCDTFLLTTFVKSAYFSVQTGHSTH